MEVDASPSIDALKEHALLSAFLQGFHKESSSGSSSSIGTPSSSSSSSNNKDDGDEQVQSQLKESPLGSLDSLEDSLPIKRGLSNFFSGKSKSYATLSDAASSGELAKKPENPLNKRRRILVTCKASAWSRRRASCSSLLHPLQPPPDDDDDDDDDDEKDDGDPSPAKSSPLSNLPPPPGLLFQL